MHCLDATGFRCSAVYDEPNGTVVAALLDRIVAGETVGTTTIPSIEAVVDSLAREVTRAAAIVRGHRILKSWNRRIPPAEGVHALRALSAMETLPEPSPRDAMPYATMHERDIHTIASGDADVDAIPDVTRHALQSSGISAYETGRSVVQYAPRSADTRCSQVGNQGKVTRPRITVNYTSWCTGQTGPPRWYRRRRCSDRWPNAKPNHPIYRYLDVAVSETAVSARWNSFRPRPVARSMRSFDPN